jgi:hypothetical protein
MLSSTPDHAPVVLRIVEGPSWITLDSATGSLHGRPLGGDPGLSTLVVTASTPTGGVTAQTYTLALFRPTESPDAWLPWPSQNTEAGASPRDDLDRGRARTGLLERPPPLLGFSCARISGGEIFIRLPWELGTCDVRVFSPVRDGLLGTADDVELLVRRSLRVADGRDLVTDLGSVPSLGMPLWIQLGPGGDRFLIMLDFAR